MTAAQAQLARVEAEGSADHPHRLALITASGPHSARDLADCVHLFCSLYGRHPGLIELALNNCPAGPVRDWLREASDAYERERLYLVRLTAVGRAPALDPRRRRNRSRRWSPSAMRSKPLPSRSAAAARLAPRPR